MASLRAELAEKFPASPPRSRARFETGCAALDQTGGLLRGGVTEGCGAGGQLVVSALLDAAVRQGFWMALVDAADVFEPADWPPAQLDRLLWIMAGGVGRSLKAADLLVRDSNLPVLVLDLQMVPPRELQRIPSSTWHRFQRLLEETATVFVVLTPQPMVEGAACRMALHLDAELSALHRPRRELLGELSCRIFERGSLRLSA